MALPVLTAITSLTALSAYLNAKFHIVNDLKSGRSPTTPTAKDLAWLQTRTDQHKLLTYDLLADHAASPQQHDRPFVIFEGRTWSYGEFFENVTKVANWLVEEVGVKGGEGEVVALDGGNSVEYLMLWFAIEAVGSSLSCVNCNLTGDGLVHCVKLCETRFLITDQDVKANVEPIRSQLDEIGCQITYYTPSLFSTLNKTTPIPPSFREKVTQESPRNLIYTSGTTGLPKGVMLGTARELMTGRVVSNYLKLTPNDRMYTCMPLYHGAAHALCTTPIIHAGGTIVLGRKFSHRTFWPEVHASKATTIQYVGELCRYLVNSPPHPLERAHVVQRAWGNGMRPDVWEPFRERFNIPVINELYSATDGLGPLYNRNEGPFTANALGLRGAIWNWRFGDQEVRVKMDVDTEDILRGEDGWAVKCKDGEPGQVLHRLTEETDAAGPAYYLNQKATDGRRIRDVFEKGDLWFKSGDMMRQDASGLVYFIDRLGDTFRWKSENVSTNEVSDVLTSHPSIIEANVYGVSLPGYDGRAGCASIVLAPSLAFDDVDWISIANHVRKLLPGYAVPIFLRVTEELEYTGTLKLQKGRLKREGVDLEKVSGKDRWVWLPVGEVGYVEYGKAGWEDVKAKRVRL
ncbi:acetyl-CoA synthetase-like protein [Periconia macrospinosa]|uniref:Acetyl-CoA synthetase-like protein n=1 Tax=Periconia macrospinosa TaxID=97972 RepID=A0A2V1DZY9_9PLEO|nr:acetyl-CoA synthetase-like protein [Periconia macrospinosa]